MSKRKDIVVDILMMYLTIMMEGLAFFFGPRLAVRRWKESWHYTRQFGGNFILNVAEAALREMPMAGATVNEEPPSVSAEAEAHRRWSLDRVS